MEEKLDFSLPEKKKKCSGLSALAVVLLIVLIGVAGANLGLRLRSEGGKAERPELGLSAEQAKELAGKLAARSLYGQAAGVWKEYLGGPGLDDKERAKTLFQVGTLFEKDGAYADAIEYYYRSEAAAKMGELEAEMNAHVKNCFERLGKFSALRYEMMDRTSIKGEKEAGGKVVAEIGSEKITEADLDAIIESAVDNQLSSMSAYLTSEQLSAEKKKMLEQYKEPEAKANFVQGWVAQEILYRQALEEGLAEKAEVKRVLDEVGRGVLSQRLMDEQLASKINLTDTDVQTYYEANKKNYMEPEKAKISHILVGDEEGAKKVLERAKGGEDFGALAKEVSVDEKTRSSGGKIEGEVTKGGVIPGIGDCEELNGKIFAAKAGEVIDGPVKVEKGWEVVRVESLEPERQKSFDEVRQQAQMELSNKKRQEVQAEYIKQMMDKHNVIIHTAAFAPENAAKEGEPAK